MYTEGVLRDESRVLIHVRVYPWMNDDVQHAFTLREPDPWNHTGDDGGSDDMVMDVKRMETERSQWHSS